MTTIEPTTPSNTPVLPILQVGEERPLLEGFLAMESAAEASRGRTSHGFIDAHGRLLSVSMVRQRPVLRVRSTPPPDVELVNRVRHALSTAAEQADDTTVSEAGFDSRKALDGYVRDVLALQSLPELVAVLCEDLRSEQAKKEAPDDLPSVDKRRRLCKLMGTC